MNWASLSDFLAMGGYGLYVWGSFAMVGAAFAWEALMLVQRRASALDNLRERRLQQGRSQ
ncbi:MAG TPA: heme exporter protein CcmD [Burkholderiaceae bacterium]|nr:heme exporter protein CcmD [Burkholderiaceae bacterium]